MDAVWNEPPLLHCRHFRRLLITVAAYAIQIKYACGAWNTITGTVSHTFHRLRRLCFWVRRVSLDPLMALCFCSVRDMFIDNIKPDAFLCCLRLYITTFRFFGNSHFVVSVWSATLISLVSCVPFA